MLQKLNSYEIYQNLGRLWPPISVTYAVVYTILIVILYAVNLAKSEV